MSKTALTVFLCTGKYCTKAWRRICDGSPAKWLRRQLDAAGLPYKLNVIETECMDRCEQAACLCCVHGHAAAFEMEIRCGHDADRVLAGMRSCVERSESPAETPS